MRTAILVMLALPLVAGGCHRANPDAGDSAVADAPDLAEGAAADLATDGDMAAPATADLAQSGPPDMATPAFRIFDGVTTDGWAAIVDAADSAWAVKVSDGTKRHIADHARFASATANVIFVEHDVGGSGVGPLELWHSDAPPVHLTDTAADLFGAAPPVADGAGHVAYYVWVAPGIGKLVVDTVDHARPRVVLQAAQDVDLPGPCTPRASFFAGRLIVLHCAYPATTRTILSSYDVTGSADVDLATDARDFSTAKNVGVLIASTAGTVTLAAPDGSGTPATLTSDVRTVRFTADGSAAVLVTKMGALERMAMSDHAITPLQPTGSVRSLFHVSKDGSFVTYSHTVDANTGYPDLWMSDARTAGTTAVVLDAATNAFSFGFDFTDDSKLATYFVDIDPNTRIGSLRTRPVAGGVERTLSAASDFVYPVGGSRIVYTENLGGTYPDERADLMFVDLASGAAPTKLATQAYYDFGVLDAGATLVYLQPGDGLHTVALP